MAHAQSWALSHIQIQGYNPIQNTNTIPKYRIKYIVDPTKQGNPKRGENTRLNLYGKATKSLTPKHV